MHIFRLSGSPGTCVNQVLYFCVFIFILRYTIVDTYNIKISLYFFILGKGHCWTCGLTHEQWFSKVQRTLGFQLIPHLETIQRAMQHVANTAYASSDQHTEAVESWKNIEMTKIYLIYIGLVFLKAVPHSSTLRHWGKSVQDRSQTKQSM